MTLSGFEPEPCETPCPQGAVLEEEPVCHEDYEDRTNGGCNSDPYVFHELGPDVGVISVCGETGVFPYQGMCYRDTDWYEIVLDEPREVELCCQPSFDALVGLVAGTCEGGVYFEFSTSAYMCEQACVSGPLDPGTYWAFVAPMSWKPLPCGFPYWLGISGYTTAVEGVSWGSIKSLYRASDAGTGR